MSHVERSAAHVRDFGKNISLIWKPDATSFVAIVSQLFLFGAWRRMGTHVLDQPDGQTISLAVRDPSIRKCLFPAEQPSKCAWIYAWTR